MPAVKAVKERGLSWPDIVIYPRNIETKYCIAHAILSKQLNGPICWILLMCRKCVKSRLFSPVEDIK